MTRDLTQPWRWGSVNPRCHCWLPNGGGGGSRTRVRKRRQCSQQAFEASSFRRLTSDYPRKPRSEPPAMQGARTPNQVQAAAATELRSNSNADRTALDRLLIVDFIVLAVEFYPLLYWPAGASWPSCILSPSPSKPDRPLAVKDRVGLDLRIVAGPASGVKCFFCCDVGGVARPGRFQRGLEGAVGPSQDRRRVGRGWNPRRQPALF